MNYEECMGMVIRPLLEIFGSNLHHLRIKDQDCKMADLAMCTQLESLFIKDPVLDEEEDVSARDVDTFLPQLKSFECGGCLGNLSHFFEEKPGLGHLDFDCSLVGIDMGPKKKS